jgi:WD40 repeat protein
VLDAVSGKFLSKLVDPKDGVGAKVMYRNLVFSPDGQLLAATTIDSSIWVWHVATGL